MYISFVIDKMPFMSKEEPVEWFATTRFKACIKQVADSHTVTFGSEAAKHFT